MSEAPEQETRRSRRRSGLLWMAPFVVLTALVTVGAFAVLHEHPSHGVADADGTGIAPVLSSPPPNDGQPDTSLPVSTPPATSAPGTSASREVLTRTAVGGVVVPSTSTATHAAVTAVASGSRAHGLHLILTSTLSQPLRPGADRVLNVTVRNPNSFSVDLYRLDVRVDPSPVAGCLASWVIAGRYRYDGGPRRQLPASASTVVALPIKMMNLVDVDQNACQGTFFPLRLSGIAVDSA